MTTTSAAAIQAQGLAKTYGATRALSGVDLEVQAGTVLGLLGPNGAGKTTAVRILATLLRPSAGHGVCEQGVKPGTLRGAPIKHAADATFWA